jgi:L-threonylcarbamoyladenylate synthase
METRILRDNWIGIAAAAKLIRAGQPVAVPTETVFGLAADATNGEAVARIYAAKGRPSFNPLIVHVTSLAQAEQIACFSPTARALAARHWPGPLTLVLPLREDSGIAPLVTAGLPTIAVRASAHPTMRALIEAVGRPLAAPSANASGRISATRAEHVRSSLDGRIPLILEGHTSHGLESTIVAVEDEAVRLLRPGPIAAETLGASTSSSKKIEAPGQLESHYAPSKPLRLNATEAAPDECLIAFGPMRGAWKFNLSTDGDLLGAAANLFFYLHLADQAPCARIAIAPIPDEGIGIAINDRLRRAAAPR